MQCDLCESKDCYNGKDCFKWTESILSAYTAEDRDIHRAAAAIEARHYMQKTRIDEVILFCREIGYERLGVAFCIGLQKEAKIICSFLRQHFAVFSVCCKICGVSKDVLLLEKIDENRAEVMCNPIIQARALENDETQLNITVGLCVGHDILFNKHSHVSVTALVVKDRVLAHNPVGAVYSGYYRKIIGT